MFEQYMYALCELVPTRYGGTDFALICVSEDRGNLEELMLSLWQEYEYEVFWKNYYLGQCPADWSASYAHASGHRYAEKLSIVKVPVYEY